MNGNEATLLWVDEYSRMAEAYDARVVPRFRPFAERLVDRARLPPNGTVLDVATGTGLTSLLAAKALGGRGLVVAIDLSDGALAVAQTNAARAGLRNLRFEMLDSRNIVYRGQAFDAALSSFGIPTVGHEAVFREVLRVLREGATYHAAEWAGADDASGFNPFNEAVAAHGTKTPTSALAQLREASAFVAGSGEYAAIRDPSVVAARMKAAGFSSVAVEPYAAPVEFASLEDLVTFRSAWGTVERELAEMGADARGAFLEDLAARLRPYRHGDGVRLTWTVAYYAATR